MKILAISLLRIGDLMMHVHILRAVRKMFPKCEIHLLVNELSESFAKEIEIVDQVNVFPRQKLQKFLVE